MLVYSLLLCVLVDHCLCTAVSTQFQLVDLVERSFYFSYLFSVLNAQGNLIIFLEIKLSEIKMIQGNHIITYSHYLGIQEVKFYMVTTHIFKK